MPKRKLNGQDGNGGSLTSSLFGNHKASKHGHDSDSDSDSDSNGGDHPKGTTIGGLFGSTNFAKAVASRVRANEALAEENARIRQTKIDTAAARSLLSSSSPTDIVQRRQKQSAKHVVDAFTLSIGQNETTDEDDDDKEKEDDDDMALPLPLEEQAEEVVRMIRHNGFAVVQNIVDKDLLETLSSRANELQTELCAALDKRNVPWRVTDDCTPQQQQQQQSGPGHYESFRFYEVASRCRGRMDFRYGTDQAPFTDDRLLANPTLLHIVHSLLGSQGGNIKDKIQDTNDNRFFPSLVYAGLILSLPGSDDQPWHQDGTPLFPEQHGLAAQLPPYAINVFLPLTDQDAAVEAGPTEFVPGSHRLAEQQVMGLIEKAETGTVKDGDDDANDSSGSGVVVSPVLRQGDALIYDYRVCHRGTSNLTAALSGNKTGRVRRILYLMFARPWFKEHLNFGNERLFPCVSGHSSP